MVGYCMDGRDVFSGYHPVVNFIYFMLMLLFAMCFLHPVSLGISLAAALLYALQLKGKKAVGRTLLFLAPMLLLAALLNPVFNHEGITILCYLPTGNPLTLESIVYGVAAAVMLACVILWFVCYSAVMCSDKFIYLFGRIIPALSLVLSMTLRFIPRFKLQLQTVIEAQRCVGRDMGSGSVFQRMKYAMGVCSILITWALETAIETADSMKSRGYGLPGRTAFSIYRMEKRDKKMLVWLVGCGAAILASWAAGLFTWRYYPTVQQLAVTPTAVLAQVLYLGLCVTPVLLNQREGKA